MACIPFNPLTADPAYQCKAVLNGGFILRKEAEKLYNRTPKRLIRTKIKSNLGSLKTVDIDIHWGRDKVLLACEPMSINFFRIN